MEYMIVMKAREVNLNTYAKNGWRVKEILKVHHTGLGSIDGMHIELDVLLERESKEPTQ